MPSCENIYPLSIVIALTACSFSIKKSAKMSVFLCGNRKNSLAAGGFTLDFVASILILLWAPLCQIPGCGPPFFPSAQWRTQDFGKGGPQTPG